MVSPKSSKLNTEEIEELLRGMEETARRISKKWPKGLTSVEAVRRDRD